MKIDISKVDQATLIAYYCRHCEKIVKGVSKGKEKRYSFICPNCQNDVIYGTARSLIRALRIKEHSENGQLLVELQKEKSQEQIRDMNK